MVGNKKAIGPSSARFVLFFGFLGNGTNKEEEQLGGKEVAGTCPARAHYVRRGNGKRWAWEEAVWDLSWPGSRKKRKEKKGTWKWMRRVGRWAKEEKREETGPA